VNDTATVDLSTLWQWVKWIKEYEKDEQNIMTNCIMAPPALQ
jgi:protein-tyrosine phosphatase